jgi:quercetin dioxygenase-like cupin family protein
MLRLVTAIFTILLFGPFVRAQAPDDSIRPRTNALMTQDVVGVPGMEVTMSTVQYAPGASSSPHAHNAQVFVYVLEGHVIMQVKGGLQMTLGPGETFYETPTDIHSVSANASTTEPAKFLVFMLKDKNAKTTPALAD